MRKFATVLDLIKLAQPATARGRYQASQKSMARFKKNLDSGNPFNKQKPTISPQAKPIKPTNPSITSPPGAANIGSGGIKSGFAAKQFNPFGKQTERSTGVTPALKSGDFPAPFKP